MAAAASTSQMVWLSEDKMSHKDFPRVGKAVLLDYRMSHVPAFRMFYEKAVSQGLFLLERILEVGQPEEYCIPPPSLTYEDFWRAFEFHKGVWQLVYPLLGQVFIDKLLSEAKRVDQGSRWEPMAALMLEVAYTPVPNTKSQ